MADFRIIDADGHVQEKLLPWAELLQEPYRPLPEARQRPSGQKLYGGGRKIAAQARGFVIRISHFIDMSSVIGYSSKPPRHEDEIS